MLRHVVVERQQRASSLAAVVARASKLIESAQARWHELKAPHLDALLRAGATFINGNLVERSTNREPTSKSRDTLIHRS